MSRALRSSLLILRFMVLCAPFVMCDRVFSEEAKDQRLDSILSHTTFIVTHNGKQRPDITVDFVWAPYCGYSVKKFHDIIYPIITTYVGPSNGKFVVRLIQDTRNTTELEGPGPILQCVPTDQYGFFVSDYLLQAYANGAYLNWQGQPYENMERHKIHKFMIEVGRKYGLRDDIDKCFSSNVASALIVTRKYIDYNFRSTETPVIAINGKLINGINSIDDMNRELVKYDKMKWPDIVHQYDAQGNKH